MDGIHDLGGRDGYGPIDVNEPPEPFHAPWEARLRVTLPAISHGLFAAAVFSFLVSWDEVVVAVFMASPSLQTLPVKIWTTLRQDLTPVVAAASTLLVLFTIALMLAAALVRKGMKR